MRYFLQNTYLFTAIFCCIDSPLSIHLSEVKSMELVMFLMATYYFNIVMLLKLIFVMK